MSLANLTDHAHRVHALMLRAKQTTPILPTMPDEKTRLLRAKLIMEEALETIEALGVTVFDNAGTDLEPIARNHLSFAADGEPDLVGIADGCADVSVVTIGALLACGIADKPLLELVDNNNLTKFAPGHSFREDGKLVKPPGFVGPDVVGGLKRQGWSP